MRNLNSKLLLLVCFQIWVVTGSNGNGLKVPPEPAANTTTHSPPTTQVKLNTTTPITTTSTPNTTTVIPTTPSTPKTTIPTPTPSTNTTTSTIPPPTTPNTTTTVAPTPAPITTSTIAPKTTSKPQPDRKFDGPSFIGGMILTMGLMAIAFVAWKFYKARTERNYHTL